jgi:nicotinate-nucleotide adenylyltransferase
MTQKTQINKMGIFGGTFDPPHLGHLIIAELAREQLGLNIVMFVPAFIPPHKSMRNGATPNERYEMIKKAIQGYRYFQVSRSEIMRKGVSYTADTLSEFKKKYPKTELFLILGSDNLLEFDSWKSPSEILSLATIAVYDRPGFDASSSTVMTRVRPIRLLSVSIDISSSAIRRRVKEGKTIRFLVPASVERFIKSKRLYQ